MTTPTQDRDIAELIEQAAEAADAWVRGDMKRYLERTHHAAGFSLIAPDGGPPRQFADRGRDLEDWESPFADGEATLEITSAHAWGDTAVLVMIERQHGRIGDRPDRDLSLRVTEVYRRATSGWELVHRHADPLTRVRSLDELTSLLG